MIKEMNLRLVWITCLGRWNINKKYLRINIIQFSCLELEKNDGTKAEDTIQVKLDTRSKDSKKIESDTNAKTPTWVRIRGDKAYV